MELLITKKAFNDKLSGKAVQLVGYDDDGTDISGLYLVRYVEFDKLMLTTRLGQKLPVFIRDVESGLIKIRVLE